MPGHLGHISEEGHQRQASLLGLLSAGCPYVGRGVCGRAVTYSRPVCAGLSTVLPASFRRWLKGEQGATDKREDPHNPRTVTKSEVL